MLVSRWVTEMDKEDFDKEMHYRITMLYVKQLKNKGIITDEEYNKIDGIMLKKYRPIIATLLSGKRLT